MDGTDLLQPWSSSSVVLSELMQQITVHIEAFWRLPIAWSRVQDDKERSASSCSTSLVGEARRSIHQTDGSGRALSEELVV